MKLYAQACPWERKVNTGVGWMSSAETSVVLAAGTLWKLSPSSWWLSTEVIPEARSVPMWWPRWVTHEEFNVMTPGWSLVQSKRKLQDGAKGSSHLYMCFIFLLPWKPGSKCISQQPKMTCHKLYEFFSLWNIFLVTPTLRPQEPRYLDKPLTFSDSASLSDKWESGKSCPTYTS